MICGNYFSQWVKTTLLYYDSSLWDSFAVLFPPPHFTHHRQIMIATLAFFGFFFANSRSNVNSIVFNIQTKHR